MPKEEKVDNDFGVASLVLGILSTAFSFLILPPLIIGVCGIVFGSMQVKKAKNRWAIWGIALSALGILIAAFIFWELYMMSVQFRNMVNQCAANPSTPGCENIVNLMGGAPAA
jgi:ABC-type multidrug transport system permease subunit